MKTRINNATLGVQSYTLRNIKDFDEVAKIVTSFGLNTIEICGVHFNVNDEKSCEYVLSVCEKYNIKLPTMGVDGYSANDKTGAVNRFEFAKKAGMKYLAADPKSDEESVDFLENLCEKYGIKLMVHNHGSYHKYGNYEQLDALFSKFSLNMGLHMDAAWAMEAGLNPIEMVQRYSDRLYGIHLKDFKFDENGKHVETVLGEGDLDLKGLLKAVEKAPNFSVMSIEYELEDAVLGLEKCIENYKSVDLS